MKPGASCRDIANAHDAYMKQRGLPPEIRLYAHSQGYDMVERPMIRADETMPIEANMNFAVHPGYETATMWTTICDNYMVGSERRRRLHAQDREEGVSRCSVRSLYQPSWLRQRRRSARLEASGRAHPCKTAYAPASGMRPGMERATTISDDDHQRKTTSCPACSSC